MVVQHCANIRFYLEGDNDRSKHGGADDMINI